MSERIISSSSSSSSSKRPVLNAVWSADNTTNSLIRYGMWIAAGLALYLAYTIFTMRPAAYDGYVESFMNESDATHLWGLKHKQPPAQNYSLIPQNNLAVYLGTGSVPNGPPPIANPEDPAEGGVSVSGSLGGPKSAFVFKYNKTNPGCCLQSQYSSTGGCVCLTKDQQAMIRHGGSI